MSKDSRNIKNVTHCNGMAFKRKGEYIVSVEFGQHFGISGSVIVNNSNSYFWFNYISTPIIVDFIVTSSLTKIEKCPGLKTISLPVMPFVDCDQCVQYIHHEIKIMIEDTLIHC